MKTWISILLLCTWPSRSTVKTGPSFRGPGATELSKGIRLRELDVEKSQNGGLEN